MEDMHTMDFPDLGEGLGAWDSASNDECESAFVTMATSAPASQLRSATIVQFHASLPVRVEILEERSDDGTVVPLLCKRRR